MRELQLNERVAARVAGAADAPAAVFLPGWGMGVEWPPMRFAAIHLLSLGWQVMLLRWQPEERPEWVEEQAAAALGALGTETGLLVGKSWGTHAISYAVERGLPGIWFTPLLTEKRIAAALERAAAPTLLVGGTRDDWWDAALVERLPVESLTVVGADHSLEFDDAWETVDLQRRVLERVDAFVRGIG